MEIALLTTHSHEIGRLENSPVDATVSLPPLPGP